MLPYIYIILPSFVVFAFIGGFVALLFIYSRIDKFGVKFTDLLKVFVICAVAAFVGGKALFVLTMIPWLVVNFSMSNLLLLILQSGFVFYGGLFGVLLTLKVYTKFSKYEELAVYRMIAPAIPLFHAFGRIGCFFAGCCYGKELNTPIKIRHMIQMERFPVQAIESLFEFVLFVVMILIDRKKKHTDLLKIYLLSYAVFRFMNEFFRGDEVRGIYMGLSTAQWISLAIVAYYAVVFMRNSCRKPLSPYEGAIK
jgi:phosphatidylglycerol:prolipoprotein diacylglycerol transferase